MSDSCPFQWLVSLQQVWVVAFLLSAALLSTKERTRTWILMRMKMHGVRTVHGYRFLQYPTWDPDRTTTWTLHKLIYARYHGVVASEEARLQNSRE